MSTSIFWSQKVFNKTKFVKFGSKIQQHGNHAFNSRKCLRIVQMNATETPVQVDVRYSVACKLA